MSAARDSSLSVGHEDSLLFCVESTALLNVIDEYFSVNILFVLVLPVQVRGQCSKNWPAFNFNSQFAVQALFIS